MQLLRCCPSVANAANGVVHGRHRTKFLVLMAVATAVYLLIDRTYVTGTRTQNLVECRWCNQSSQSSADDVSEKWNKVKIGHIQNLTNGTAVMPQATLAGVPMLLHLTYRDTNILEAYRVNTESCTRLNSNWTVILWTDDSVKLFLAKEFPNLQDVFYRFKHKIQRSDAIRYIVLYRFGGVYMDMDIHCRRPLLSSLSNIPCFLDKEREFQTNHLHQRGFTVMNSAMGCRPRHPFFKMLIDYVFNAERLSSKLPYPMVVFETTGPFMLTRLYQKWKASNSTPPVTLLGETYFSPLLDPGIYRDCRRVMAQLGKRRTSLSHMETSCLKISELGYEKSDNQFLTNLTVAAHQFSHFGYKYQTSGKFDMLKVFPGILTYDSAAASKSADWPPIRTVLPQR